MLFHQRFFRREIVQAHFSDPLGPLSFVLSSAYGTPKLCYKTNKDVPFAEHYTRDTQNLRRKITNREPLTGEHKIQRLSLSHLFFC